MAEPYDVVVIGGGIHGVGVAQAAACAGCSVLLLEQRTLAAGSSSRSSKLIHGGLRYLEGHDFALVRESLHERATLLKIAPDLVRLQPFHIPVYPDTSRRPLTLQLGLSLYALLAGFGPGSGFRRLRRGEWNELDGLDTTRLQAVFRYHDAQTDDAALTRAVMHSAQQFGAELACPAEFVAARLQDRHCEVQYREQGVEKHCRARTLVNAAGAWAGIVATLIHPAVTTVPVELIQGAHLLLEGALAHGCYYMEAPQDRRAVFLLPWGGHCLLGTTERRYRGDPDAVQVLPEEEQYLLEVVRRYFPQRPERVIDRFAGLRVLPAADGAAFSRSRETRLAVDREQQPRVVSIYGGKLTGYRATAQKVLQQLAGSLPARRPVASTADLRLVPVD
jgi:glycerol-3-phosphate dehydrogenase